MIKYRKIELPTRKPGALLLQGRTISTKEIAKEIEDTIGIPMIRTMSVLNAFVETVYGHLEEGEPVALEGFGTFKPGLATEGGKTLVKKVNLFPSVRMKERLAGFRTVEEPSE